LVLTRMREDNHGIIKINRELGMKGTGIYVPCSLTPGMNHQFWYQVYLPE